jgi:hypothetical protein
MAGNPTTQQNNTSYSQALLYPAAPLLPAATSPISCLLLAACRPKLVFALAAQHLVIIWL